MAHDCLGTSGPNASTSAATSIGSPISVPVPWRLDVRNFARVNTGQVERFGDHARLPANAWRKVTHLVGSVVVDGGSPYHGTNAIPVSDGFRKSLQQDTPRCRRHDGSIRIGVKGTAMSVRRKDLTRPIEIAGLLRIDC